MRDREFDVFVEGGGLGDSDGAADGIIIDPIGPAIPDSGSSSSSTIADNIGASAGSGCGALGFDAIALLGMTYILRRKLRKERSK